ncbi:MAG: 30S ribosome-binding factor RbfA [Actinobacteria bacterium]|jgi:ribosome-binding factor A|nr:30S ribosome-binding factor RbfA [Actinomycetota bacterium]
MGHRLLKVNEGIRKVLSATIAEEGLKDPRVGFVTVTGVETTPDLRQARVYVSVLGDERQREVTLQALEASRGYLQAQINATLRMKRTPQLQFLYDDTLDHALRIQSALKREAAVLGEEPHEIPVPGMDDAGLRTEDAGETAGGSGRPPGDDGESDT